MKKYKILLLLVFIFVMLFAIYFFSSKYLFTKIENIAKQKQENTFEKIEIDDKVFFLIYKEPICSFGSGHKYLYVFSKNRLLLDYCKFGEFPLTILSITEKQINIEINYSTNNKYVENWLKKNKKLWKYELKYLYLEN